MNFRRIKFYDAGVLGNLEFDFTNHTNDTIYKNIVLVGKNGSGKTSLLNHLEDFCSQFDYYKDRYSIVEYEINGKKLTAKTDRIGTKTIFSVSDGKEIYTDQDYGIKDDMPHKWHPNSNGVIYSHAQGDIKKEESLDDIVDLLKKMQNEDIIDYAYNNIENNDSPEKWDQFFPTSKTYRFARAINSFFPNIEYFGLGFDKQHKAAIGFKKNGRKYNIYDLSSGEKQIIQKTIYLLRNNPECNLDMLLLMDEPENSYHPEWQRRYFKYLKTIYSDAFDIQHNQQFIASHSPYFLKEALLDSSSLVYRLYEENGIVKNERIEGPLYLQQLTYAEINFVVFGIATPEYHNQLYCQIQINNSLSKVKATDNFIKNHSSYKSSIHSKHSAYQSIDYYTIPTYIRNSIDHFDNGNTYTEEELINSIKLMQEMLST